LHAAVIEGGNGCHDRWAWDFRVARLT